MNTVDGINSWIRENRLEGIVSLLILAAVLFGASSVLSWLWSEHRWYLYLSFASATIVFPWMAWDLKNSGKGPR